MRQFSLKKSVFLYKIGIFYWDLCMQNVYLCKMHTF